jgi:hypothetical protein
MGRLADGGFAHRMGVAILSEVVLSAVFVDSPTSSGDAGFRAQDRTLKFALRPDSSVVERGPEKAGVGGSIPSLATTF